MAIESALENYFNIGNVGVTVSDGSTLSTTQTTGCNGQGSDTDNLSTNTDHSLDSGLLFVCYF